MATAKKKSVKKKRRPTKKTLIRKKTGLHVACKTAPNVKHADCEPAHDLNRTLRRLIDDEVEKAIIDYDQKQTNIWKNRPAKKKWTLAEVLYGFTGILTQRKVPLIFSGRHNASQIAEYLGEFLKVNNIDGPRDDYPKFDVPKMMDGLTNDPTYFDTKSTVRFVPLQEAFEQIYEVLNNRSHEDKERILAGLIDKLLGEKAMDVKAKTEVYESTRDSMDDAQEQFRRLQKISQGDILLVPKTS